MSPGDGIDPFLEIDEVSQSRRIVVGGPTYETVAGEAKIEQSPARTAFRKKAKYTDVLSFSSADKALRLGLVAKLGVDPRYALDSRKATGFYKVPSLNGVWYRGPFGHHGSAATLEDWFDPARLRPDYVPTGFKGIDGRQRSIPGHRFGLELSAQERKDLIAFLKTL